MHIFQISQEKKDMQATKFGQLIEYNVSTIFIKKSRKKYRSWFEIFL